MDITRIERSIVRRPGFADLLVTGWLRSLPLCSGACRRSVAVGEKAAPLIGGCRLLHHRGDMTLICEALLFMASRSQLIEEVIRYGAAWNRPLMRPREYGWKMGAPIPTISVMKLFEGAAPATQMLPDWSTIMLLLPLR